MSILSVMVLHTEQYEINIMNEQDIMILDEKRAEYYFWFLFSSYNGKLFNTFVAENNIRCN